MNGGYEEEGSISLGGTIYELSLYSRLEHWLSEAARLGPEEGLLSPLG